MKATNVFLIFVLSILLQGCAQHIQEITSNFDIALGDEYKPNIKLLSRELPERVLVIPVFQEIPPAYTSVLLQKFRANLTAYDWVWLDKKTFTRSPLRSEIEQLASDNNCASVMLLHIRHPSVYPPIRVTMDIVMERLRDNLTILKGSADYDSRNEEVSSSARRYYQHIVLRQDVPDRSLAILRSNPDFFEFCGWHIAKYIQYLAVPPYKDLNKELDDPKNIQDFEPSHAPGKPRQVKKGVPVADTTPPAPGTSSVAIKNSDQTTSTETTPADSSTRFEEPPSTLQNKSSIPSGENK